MLLKYGHFPETQPSGDDGDAWTPRDALFFSIGSLPKPSF